MSPAEPSVSKDYDIEFGEENSDHGYDGDDDVVYPMETDDGIYTPRREESSKYIDQEVADNSDDNETVVSKGSCQQKDGSSQKKMRMKVAYQRIEVMVG